MPVFRKYGREMLLHLTCTLQACLLKPQIEVAANTHNRVTVWEYLGISICVHHDVFNTRISVKGEDSTSPKHVSRAHPKVAHGSVHGTWRRAKPAGALERIWVGRQRIIFLL